MEDINNKKYLTLKEAAAVFKYSPDYIGFLIRKGGIKGKRIYANKSWLTTREAVIDYCLKNKRKPKTETKDTGLPYVYISAQEAASLSGYHPDHINYLIRTGKLAGRRASRQPVWVVNTHQLAEYKASKEKRTFGKKKWKKPIVSKVKKAKRILLNVSWRLVVATFTILFLLSDIAPVFLQATVGAFLLEEPPTIKFYTNSCYGDWSNPSGAQGLPDAGPKADMDLFSGNISATYQTGALALSCKDFSILEDSQNVDDFQEFVSAKVRLSFAMGEKEPDLIINDQRTTNSEQRTEENASSTEPIGFWNKVKDFFRGLMKKTVRVAKNTAMRVNPIVQAEEDNFPIDDNVPKEETEESTKTPPFRNNNELELPEAGPPESLRDSWGETEEELVEELLNKEVEQSEELPKEDIVEEMPPEEPLIPEPEEEIQEDLPQEELEPEEEPAPGEVTDQATTTSEIIEEVIVESFDEAQDKQATTTLATTTEQQSTSTQSISSTTTESIIPIDTSSIQTLPNLDTRIIIWWSVTRPELAEGDGDSPTGEWQVLGTISSYPLSNLLIGGDYFEYEAPFLTNWQDINNLKIKFEGIVGGETNIIAYLDSVWVEVEYQQQETGDKQQEIGELLLEEEAEGGGSGGAGSDEPTEITELEEGETKEKGGGAGGAGDEEGADTSTQKIVKKLRKVKIKQDSLLFVDSDKTDFRSDETPTFIIEEPIMDIEEMINTGLAEDLGEEIREEEVIPEEEIIAEDELILPATSTESTTSTESATSTEQEKQPTQEPEPEQDATSTEPVIDQATTTEPFITATTTEMVDGATTTEPTFEATTTELEIEATTSEPVLEATTTEPILETTTTEPILETTSTEPIEEESTTTEPVLEATSTQPTEEESVEEEPTITETEITEEEILEEEPATEEVIEEEPLAPEIEEEDTSPELNEEIIPTDTTEEAISFIGKIKSFFKNNYEKLKVFAFHIKHYVGKIVDYLVPQTKAQTAVNQKDIITVKLFEPNGQESSFIPKINSQTIEGKEKFEIKIPKPTTGFHPGVWKIQIELETDDTIFITEQEFTWGVLAINTNKSIYTANSEQQATNNEELTENSSLPNLSDGGETAYIQMAALNDRGHTICYANLNLEIISPEGNISYPQIQPSGECRGNNVTDLPDYFAYYQIQESGTYQMKLTNLDTGYEITDSFEARDSSAGSGQAIPFDVERVGPTRIYPPEPYEMTLKIKANQDFTGEITETVPAGFEIIETGDKEQETKEDVKEIIWDVVLKEGDQIELNYTFDALNISPYLYLLGPLTFSDQQQATSSKNIIFQESRRWQIAADTPAGPNYPGVVTTNGTVDPWDDEPWITPEEASSSNNVYANVGTKNFDAGEYTYQLLTTNFGFNIPTYSTIDGIKVEWEGYRDQANVYHDLVQLTNRDGTRVGDDKADGTVLLPDSEQIVTFGSDIDDWNVPVEFDYNDINSTNFGVAYACASQTNNSECWVDYIRITVYYTEPVFVSVSGTVYTNEGGATMGSGRTVRVKVNGEGDYSGTTDESGNYTANSIPELTIGDVITVFLDGASEYAATITKASSTDGNITELDLYQDRVIITDEATSEASTTIADMAVYDSSNDDDIRFTAATGTATSTTISTSTKLYIWPGKTFDAGGEVTIFGDGPSGGSTDGDLHIAEGATYIAGATTTIAGDWIASSSSTFTDNGYEVILNATTSKNIWASTNTDFGILTFNGVGGEWVFKTAATSTATTTITNGTTTQAADENLTLSSLTIGTNGAFTKASGSGKLYFEDTDTIIIEDADEDQNLGDVYIGLSPAVVKQNSDIIVDSFTVNTGDEHYTRGYEIDSASFVHIYGTLDATADKETDLSNISLQTDWTIESGGSFVDGNSTTTFDGTTLGHTITTQGTSNDFYAMVFDGSGGGWEFASGDHKVSHDFIITNGIVTSTEGTLQVGGSWSNSDIFNATTGTVVFNSDDTGETINPGSSPFNIVTFDHTNGGWTITNDATSTNNWNLTNAAATNGFIVDTDVKIEIQGEFSNDLPGTETDWNSGSLLYLNSGSTYPINEKTTGDIYETLRIGADTEIRMWNSTSSIYTVDDSGSLYSQDHDADANGSGDNGYLYIWGDYHTSTTDYWCHETDFDGTPGANRQVYVKIAPNSTTTLDSGDTLHATGTDTATTSIDVQDSGNYALKVEGGTLDFKYYQIRNTDAYGLNITGSPTITELGYGDFELSVDGGSMITVEPSVIEVATKTFHNNRFSTSTVVGAGSYNVNLTDTPSSNYWLFQNHYGNYDGESYDSDPGGDPGYIRWADSTFPAELNQRSVRWHNDDGNNVTSTSNVDSADKGITMERGQRATLRIQIDNTAGGATGSTTTDYQLQFVATSTATTTCSEPDSSWQDVTSTAAISYSWGLSATDTDPVDTAVTDTSNSCGGSCSNGFVSGTWHDKRSTTSDHNLDYQQNTEFAFVIHTANATTNTTYCLRLYNKGATTTLDNYYSYATTTIVSNDTKRYSKATSSASLPSDYNDLTYYLDDAGYTAAATDDDSLVDPATSTSAYPIFLFARKHTNGTDDIDIDWSGETTVDCSTNKVILQVYNITQSAWNSLATSTDCTVGNDFDLSVDITSGASNYYDTNNWNYVRVYQESGTQTLKTDYISIGVYVPLGPAITQRAYIFENDDGNTVNTNSNMDDANTTTTLVKKGQRFIARFQIDSGETTTTAYKLQYDKYDNQWVDIDYGGAPNINSGASSSDWNATTVDSTGDVGRYSSLAIGSDGNPVIAYFDDTNDNLNVLKCGNPSCTLGNATTAVDRMHSNVRQISIAIATSGNPVISYCNNNEDINIAICGDPSCSSGNTTTTLDALGAVGLYSSIAIATSGRPVIVYSGDNSIDLNFAKCLTGNCDEMNDWATTTLDTNYSGWDPSIAIGTDGYPVISYYYNWTSADDLNFARCTTGDCTNPMNWSTTTVDDVGDVGSPSSIAIGTDGCPVIVYGVGFPNEDLRFLKCGNPSCTLGNATSTIDEAGSVGGSHNSIAIGPDGLPVISYQDVTNESLKVAKCADSACSGGTTSTAHFTINDGPGDTVYDFGDYNSIAIGTDGWPVISYYDDDNDDLKVAKMRPLVELQPSWALSGATGDDLTSNEAGGCEAGIPYQTGEFYEAATTSNSITLAQNKCTELAFALDTSEATVSTTYRLRLVKEDGTTLNSYVNYPTLSIVTSSANTFRYSKDTVLTAASTCNASDWDCSGVHSTPNDARYFSIAIGTDGYPVVAYMDWTDRDLKVLKCGNLSCTAGNTTTTIDSTGLTGYRPSIAISTDGLPVISYWDNSSDSINIAKCGNPSCTAGNTITTVGSAGSTTECPSSIAIGADGNPVVSHYDSLEDRLEFFKCGNPACTSDNTLAVIDSYSDPGRYNSIAIGTDGLPVIAYNTNSGAGELIVTKCGNASCTSGNSSTTLDGSVDVDMVGLIAIGIDGYPVIPYFDNTNDALKVYHCTKMDCSLGDDYTVDTHPSNTIGWEPSLAIGPDGSPVISYYEYIDINNGNLRVLKCSNPSCSGGYTTTTVETGGSIGRYCSIAIGKDGYPVVAYQDETNAGLKVAKQLGFPKTAISYFNRYIKTDGQIKLTRNLWTQDNATTGAMWLESSPAIEDGLQYWADKAGYEAINTDDTDFDNVTSTVGTSTSTPIYVFADKHSTNTNSLYARWIGQSTKGADDNNIVLQVYRFGNSSTTTGWVTSTTQTTGCNGADCTIEGSITSNQTDYYYPEYKFNDSTGTTSADFWTFWRIWQEPDEVDAETLKTDEWNLSYTAPASGLTQRSYIFENDDGSSVNTNSNMDSANTTTTLVKKGQRFIARFQIDNTGEVSDTSTYKLQYDKYDNQWIDVDYGGAPNINSGASSSDWNATTVDDVGTVGQYSSIAIGTDGNPVISYYDGTPNLNLNFLQCGNPSCTSGNATTVVDSTGDVGEYTSIAIATSGLPIISYRDDTNDNLNFAECTSNPCTNSNNWSTTTVDTFLGSIPEYTSIAIATSGFPVIAYGNSDSAGVNFAQCTSTPCTISANWSTTTIITTYFQASLAIGTDGFPVISLYEGLFNDDLWFAQCTSTPCTISGNWSLIKIDEIGNVGSYSSMAIGADGNPVISHYDMFNDNLRVTKCGNSSCTSGNTTSTVDSGTDVGMNSSIAIGTDGNPVISYQDAANDSLKFAKCADSACSASSTLITIDDGSAIDFGAYISIAIGIDGWPVISYYDDDNDDLRVAKMSPIVELLPSWGLSGASGDTLNATAAGYCTNGASWTNGEWYEATTTSNSITLAQNKCTELAFTLDTSEATVSTTYRLRLVKSDNTTLDSYTEYPILSIVTSSANTFRYSKDSVLTEASTCGGTTEYGCTKITHDSDNVGYRSAIAIGTDGYPVIAHKNTTDGVLMVTKCSSADCSSLTTTTVISYDPGVSIGAYSSIAIGTDGYPVIAHRRSTPSRLMVTKCNSPDCTSVATTTVINYDSDGIGDYTSIAVGTDGNPIISYRHLTGTTYSLMVTKCNSTDCTSIATTTKIGYDNHNVGYYTSIAIGSDGLPIIVHQDFTGTHSLMVTKCNSADCTSIATTTKITYDSDNIGDWPSIAIGSDGYPVISHTNTAGNDSLMVTKCSSLDCTSISTTTKTTYDSDNVGWYSSIAININGYPIIAHQNTTDDDSLMVTKCSSLDCASISTTTKISYGSDIIGKYTSIAIGTDGLPIITHQNTASPNSLMVTKQLGLPKTAISYFNRYIKTDNQIKLTRNLWTQDNATTGAMWLESSPAIEDGLQYWADKAGYTAVGADDTDFDNVTSTVGSSTSTPVYVFADKHATNTNDLYAKWIGQSTKGADDNNIVLQVYRFGNSSTTTGWVTTTTKTSGCDGADCSIQGSITSNQTDYYYPEYKFNDSTGTTSADFWTFWRIWQEPDEVDAETLKTDEWNLSYTAPASDLTQRSYIFENDDGNSVNLNTDMDSANTTTTNVKKGQRFIARFQIDNTGGSDTSTYKLQYDKYDNQWIDVDYGGAPNINSGASSSDWNVTTADSSGSDGLYNSIAIGADGYPVLSYYDNAGGGGLDVTKCGNPSCTAGNITSEINDELAHDTSVAIGTDGNPVISYQDYVMDWLRLVKCNDPACSDGDETTRTLHMDGGAYTSIAIGTDGYPVISFAEQEAGSDLKVYHCTNVACSDGSVSVVESTASSVWTSIAIGTDGYPIISHWDSTANSLEVAKCNDIACSGGDEATTTIHDLSGSGANGYPSIAIGDDGNPVISYYDNVSGDLKVAKCGNSSCSSGNTTTTIDSTGDVGKYTSITIGTDGLPVISYQDDDNNSLKIAKCRDSACSSVATSSNIVMTINQGSGTKYGAYTSIAIGWDGWPVISYFDDDNDDLKVAKMQPLVELQPSWGLSGTGGDTLNATQAGDCTAGASWQNGEWYEATTTSNLITLAQNECTELAFALNTSEATASTTYRLRLAKSDNTPLDSYVNYPVLSIVTPTNNTLRYSKDSVLTAASTCDVSDWDCNSVGTMGSTITQDTYISIAIGTDGNPVIAYDDLNNHDLVVAKCGNPLCTEGITTTTIDSPGDTGEYPSIAIGTDGNPVISYEFDTGNYLRVAKCGNPSCTEGNTTTTLDFVGASWSSIAIGTDGNPFIAYKDSGDLSVVKCGNPSCTSGNNATTVDSQGPDNVAHYPSVAIGIDGNPVISYPDLTKGTLKVAKCGNPSCDSGNTITTVDSMGGGYYHMSSIAIGTDGHPVIVYHWATSSPSTIYELRVAKCGNPSCSSNNTTTTIAIGGAGTQVYSNISLAIDIDGNPVIGSYYTSSAQDITIIKCGNEDCTFGNTTTTVDSSRDARYPSEIVIGNDGYPVIAYMDEDNGNLMVAKQLGLPKTAISYFNRYIKTDNQIKLTRNQWTSATTGAMWLESSPAIEDGLQYWADKAGYTAVGADDTDFDNVTSTVGSSTSTPVYVFADKHATNTNDLYAKWIGQSTKGADDNNIVLQVYRFGNSSTTTGWVTTTTQTTGCSGSDCEITGSISTNQTDYYYPEYKFNDSTGTTSADYWTFWRVYQQPDEVDAQTLKTDEWALQYTAFEEGVTISGTVYSDEGTNNIGADKTVVLKVNGADVCDGLCVDETDASGIYSISNVTIGAADDVVTVFLDGETEKATTITKASTTDGNISGLDLYQNRVIIKHEGDAGTATTTIADMAQYDSTATTSIMFTATTTNGTATSTTLAASTKLYIWPGKTFDAGGTITIYGDGGSSPDGDLHIAEGATLIAGGDISLAGNWIASSSATFTHNNSTTTFNATTTGKEIWSNFQNFYDVVFYGSSTNSQWTFKQAASTTNNLTISVGTASSSEDMTVYGGSVTGQGVLSWTGGTFLVDGTGSFGGTGDDWTFYHLTFGDGSGTASTSLISQNSITASGNLTVASSQTLTGSKNFTVLGGDTVGDGTINLTGGTFLLDGDGNFGGTSDWTFYNLTLGDGSGLSTTTSGSTGTTTVSNVLTINNNQELDAGNKIWEMAGFSTSTPTFDINGIFTASTSNFKYTTKDDTIIATTTYYNLELLGSSWYDTSWSYRKRIPISNTTSVDLFNYQVRIHVASSSPELAGADVGCDDHCQDDFDDVRFTTTDGRTLMDYWTEATTTASSSVFWVKIPHLEANATTNIYMYYGNDSVGTVSNGDDTFIFFDDFLHLLDGSTWEIYLRGSGSHATTSDGSGILTLCPDTTDYDYAYVESKKIVGKSNISLDFYGYLYNKRYANFGFGDMTGAQAATITPEGSGYNLTWDSDRDSTLKETEAVGPGILLRNDMNSASNLTWVRQNFYYLSDGTIGHTVATTTIATSTTWLTSDKKVILGRGEVIDLGSDDFDIDWVFVRQYIGTTTEPSLATPSNEQSSTSAPTYTLATTISQILTVSNNLLIGNGTDTLTVDHDNWDPSLDIDGNFTISNNATFLASDSGTFTVAGNWSNSGTFTHNNGTVILDAASVGKTINPGGSNFYNLTFSGSGGGWTLDVASATTTNNFTITQGAVTSTSAILYVGGNWYVNSNNGLFIHNSATVLFNATDPGHTIVDGDSAFYNITFNGIGGSWLYQDGTSTVPNQTTVENGTSTFLNAKTGPQVSVTGGELNVDWYLGTHVVDAVNPATDIDTGDNDIIISNSGWYDEAWGYRKKITIDSTKVDESLTDFVILASTTDSDLSSKAQTSGNDILFTKGDGISKLNHEIESYDNASGELFAWVQVPYISSSTDTNIYMYYGNTVAGGQQNASSTWDTSYKGVWHLAEDDYTDSSGYGYHGVNTDFTNTTGQIAGGKYSDGIGNDNKIDFGDKDDFSFGDGTEDSPFTISFWYKVAQEDAENYLFRKFVGDGVYEYWVGHSATNQLWLLLCSQNTTEDNSIRAWTSSDDLIIANGWQLIHASYDGSEDHSGIELYIDGSNAKSSGSEGGTYVAMDNSTAPAQFSLSAIPGYTDEIRISNVMRSAAWIKTEFENQSSPSTFHSIGSEQASSTIAGTVWRYEGNGWGIPSSSTTTGSGADGKIPEPGATGAIRIREYSRNNVTSSYYHYNLQIDWQSNYGEYDYYDDHGNNYLTSASSTDESGVDKTISDSWHRTSSSTINSPYTCNEGTDNDCINNAPTNGSWYAGMYSALVFEIPSGLSEDLGRLDDSNSWTAEASSTLRVSTSASNGYVVTAWAINDAQLKHTDYGTVYIEKYDATNISPKVWDQTCTQNSACCGFGYTTNDSTLSGGGATNRFTSGSTSCTGGAGSGSAFAGFALSGGDPVADYSNPTTTDETIVSYKVSINAAQTAGQYSTTVIYICTANY